MVPEKCMRSFRLNMHAMLLLLHVLLDHNTAHLHCNQRIRDCGWLLGCLQLVQVTIHLPCYPGVWKVSAGHIARPFVLGCTARRCCAPVCAEAQQQPQGVIPAWEGWVMADIPRSGLWCMEAITMPGCMWYE